MSSDSPKSERLFGRYSDLALLIIGFFLTSVLGGFVGSALQYWVWSNQYRQQQHDKEMEQAEVVFAHIAKLPDGYTYAARNLLAAMERGDNEESIRKRMDAVEDAFRAWNAAFTTTAVETEWYFGLALRKKVTGDLHTLLIDDRKRIDGLFQRFISNPQEAKAHLEALAEERNQIGNIEIKSEEISREMFRLMKDGKVGISNPG